MADTTDQKEQLKQTFLDAWPLERVRNMTLDEYTNLNREDSFCYWLESKTQDIGSIWGGSAYKFGIYKRNNTDSEDTRSGYSTDGEYGWVAKYGESAEEAFKNIRSTIVSIIEAVKENDLSAIDELDLGDAVKWKIAFQYSDYQVVNIFKRNAIYEVAKQKGLQNADQEPISKLHEYLIDRKPVDTSYFDYTDRLWEDYNESQKESSAVQDMSDNYTSDVDYWLYAPGSGAEFWDEFYEEGIMAIGWDFLGDLSQYETESEIKDELQKQFDTESSKKNDKRACWDFANELKNGDIIIAKKGTTEYLGWGIVASDYIYDDSRSEYKNVRRVDWKKRGVWEGENIVPKALTKVTEYSDYVDKLKKKLSIKEKPKIMRNDNPLNTENLSLNTILFGPPGTGKTYHTVDYALSIVDPEFYEKNKHNREALVKRFRELRITDWKKSGQIAFTTFHQSFTYEDFIEGIKPELSSGSDRIEKDTGEEQQDSEDQEKDNIRYTVEPGIFKRICERARQKSGGAVQDAKNKLKWSSEKFSKTEFYKVSLGDVNIPEDDEIYEYCVKENKIAIGFINDQDLTDLSEAEIRNLYQERQDLEKHDCRSMAYFRHNLKKDYYVIVPDGNTQFRAIGRIVGDYEYNPDSSIRYNHFRNVEWIVKDLNLSVDLIYEKGFMQKAIYHLPKKFIKPEFFIETEVDSFGSKEEVKPYVLIIDEINRGNIAQIFGELITLIEEDKREGADEEVPALLPYSKTKFTVPSNLYIIGTMNTADRSVEALDTALRRRFQFEEVPPRSRIIAEEGKADNGTIQVDGTAISLPKLLDTINQRIEKILDKDHLIGHSYFMDVENWRDLKTIFQQNIIPLLEEYFYGDKGKIQLVLGKGFIEADDSQSGDGNLFPKNDYSGEAMIEDRPVWKIKSEWKQGESQFAEALDSMDINN